MPIITDERTRYAVSAHALHRFKVRHHDKIPPGASDDDARRCIQALAKHGLRLGGTTLANGRTRIRAEGVTMVVHPGSRIPNTVMVATVLCDDLRTRAKNDSDHPTPMRRLKARQKKDLAADRNDGW